MGRGLASWSRQARPSAIRLSRLRSSVASLALVAAAASPASGARALDAEVDSDTSFQIYEVRSPGARAFMARRRLLSRLAVRVTHDLTDPDPRGRVVRLTAAAQLRLEQEFGETCLLDRELCLNATDADDPGAWQPLAADTVLDVPAVWARVDGLELGVSAQLGRQLVLDEIGFVRFDGAEVAFSPVPWFRASALGGWLVRGTSIAGTPRSELPGAVRLEQGELAVPWAVPPTDTYVVGASVAGGPGRALQVRLTFRQLWEADGDVLSRLGASVSSQPADWLRLDAQGVVDLLTDEVIDARAAVAIGDDRLRVRVAAERRVPRFDPGTIWAWFALAPITEGSLGASWQPSADVSLGGAVRARYAELEDRPEDVDGGLDGWVRARVEGFRFGASGFVWSGSLGPLAGVGLDISRGLFGWLDLTLALNLWHFDDPHRPDNFGTVLSEVLTASFRLSPEAVVLAEVQHATSRLVGHRFRGVLAVRVDTWR